MTVKTRAELKAENSADFPNNVARLISPADLRGQMDDVADSALLSEDIAGLDLSEAHVTAIGNGTQTLAEWTSDILSGEAGDFSPPWTGAITWPVTQRMQEQIHLLDFIPQSEHAAIRAGTSIYDASAAFTNALASVTANDVPTSTGGPEIILPYGKLRFNSAIQINKTIILKGHGVGGPGGPSTILEFAAGQHGIIIHTVTTWGLDGGAPVWTPVVFAVGEHCYRVLGSGTNIYECIVAGPGASANPPSHSSDDVAEADGYTWRLSILHNTGGNASTLRDFHMTSLGVQGTHVGHGLWPRGKVYVENVSIANFPENGIYMVADVHPQGAGQGNANICRFTHMRISSCGKNGVYVDGGDVNGCLFQGLDCSANYGCGIWDSSFLGNSYVMTHLDGNGRAAQVSHGGNRYYVADAALASTTEPGTDEAVWLLSGAGGVHPSYPAWVSDTPYVLGNAIRTDNPNDICGVILGLYMEGNQPPPHIGASWMIVSPGSSAFSGTGSGFRIGTATTAGRLSAFQVTSATGSTTSFSTNFGNTSPDQSISWHATGDAPAGLNFGCNAIDKSWSYQWANLGAAVPIRFTGTQTTTLTGGRSVAIPGGNVIFTNGMWLGNPNRYLSSAGAVPTTGEWARGDVVLNSSPTAGGFVGWVCTTAGTPGTWKTFGVISA